MPALCCNLKQDAVDTLNNTLRPLPRPEDGRFPKFTTEDIWQIDSFGCLGHGNQLTVSCLTETQRYDDGSKLIRILTIDKITICPCPVTGGGYKKRKSSRKKSKRRKSKRKKSKRRKSSRKKSKRRKSKRKK